MDTAAAIAECIYCEQVITLADDGAWETADGRCGCGSSLECGGDGEHTPGDGPCSICGRPIDFHWTGTCPDIDEGGGAA